MTNNPRALYELCSKCKFFRPRQSKLIDGVFAKCSVNGEHFAKNILKFRDNVYNSKRIPDNCVYFFEHLMDFELKIKDNDNGKNV